MSIHTTKPPLYRRAARWAKRRIVPRGLILMYHRITEEERDPWRICVSPKNFAEHLEVLRAANIQILRAREFAEAFASGTVPRRSVVITFDDGYRDNLEQGRPILERFDAPAMLFAASGYIGSGREFWWDTMERIFLEPGQIPETLEVEIGGSKARWNFSGETHWTEADASRHAIWRPSHPPLCKRHRAHHDIRQMLISERAEVRSAEIIRLLEWAGLSASPRPGKAILDEAGLRDMARDDLVEIGGHSVSHPDLRDLPVADQETELREGKASLEALLGKPIVGLAYPHGGCTKDTRRIARELGYGFACGTSARAVERKSDLFQLPRIGIHDVSGKKFRADIAHFLPI